MDMQGNCTGRPPAPSATTPAVPSLRPRQCVLYPGITSGAFFTMERAFQSVSILLDNVAIAAPKHGARQAGAGAEQLTLVDMPTPTSVGQPDGQTREHVWLRRMTLQGPGAGGSVRGSAPGAAGLVGGLSVTQEWRVHAEGARLLAAA
jgi:hypothetical protein